MFAVDVPETAATPPPSFVDLASGSLYTLAPVSYGMPDPSTGQPLVAYEATVYVHETITGGNNPDLSAAILQDAVLRWWFTCHGKSRHLPPSTPDGEPSGFNASCEQCGRKETFASLLERALWCGPHLHQGHTINFDTKE